MRLTEGEKHWDDLNRQHGTNDALIARGVEVRGAADVANQRALRLYAALTGQNKDFRQMQTVKVRDPNLVLVLASAWMDGLGVAICSFSGTLPGRSIGLAQLAEASSSNDDLNDELGGDPKEVVRRQGVQDMEEIDELIRRRARNTVAVTPPSNLQRKLGTPTIWAAAGAMWLDGCAAAVSAASRLARGEGVFGQPPHEEL